MNQVSGYACRLFCGAILITYTLTAGHLMAEEQGTSTPAQSKIVQPLPTGATAATTVNAPAVADETAVVVATPSFLVANVDEFSVIYDRLLALGYPRGAGHAVAASRMVNCVFNNTAVEKADFLHAIISNLAIGTEGNVRRRTVLAEIHRVGGDIRNSAQAANLAAILTCKLGTREYANLAADFDAALLELTTKMGRPVGPNAIFPFFQLASVAELMN